MATIIKKHGSQARKRRHLGIAGKRPDLYDERVASAKKRTEERAKRTDAEQIVRLDAAHLTAKKERARFQKKMDEAKK